MDIVPHLLGTHILAALPVSGRARMARRFVARVYADGEPLLGAAATESGLHVLLDGAADVWLHTGRRRVRTAELRAGDVFGESSIFAPDLPSGADVVGRGQGLIGRLSGLEWEALRAEDATGAGAIGAAVIRSLSYRLQFSSSQLLDAMAERGFCAPPEAAAQFSLPDTPPRLHRDLHARFTTREVPAGVLVADEGGTSDAMWLLVDGSAEYLRSYDGERVRVALVSAGAVFGNIGIFSRSRRVAGVRAVTPLRLLELSAEGAEALLAEPSAVADLFRRTLLHSLCVHRFGVDGALRALALEA